MNTTPIVFEKWNRALLEAARFVSRARARKDARYSLNHVLINRDHMVASDGHRLHVFSFNDQVPSVGPNHPEGEQLYDVTTYTQTRVVFTPAGEDGAKFPNYRKLIVEPLPDLEIDSGWPSGKEACLIKAGLMNFKLGAELQRRYPDNQVPVNGHHLKIELGGLNVAYLADAIEFCPTLYLGWGNGVSKSVYSVVLKDPSDAQKYALICGVRA